jgi:hypothetical protein
VQNTLYIEIIGSMSEKGFSLDELVIRVKELFETKAMAKVVGLLLSLADEYLCWNIVRGKKGWSPEACCPLAEYEHKDRLDRRFRTSVGLVEIRWWRLRCKKCGKTVIPLREFLGIEHFQSKSAEMEKMVAEVVSEQSYRRTSRHLDLIGEIPVPKSTAHRWVMESDCDELAVDGKAIGIVVADGTGYKRRPDGEKNNRGELKVVLGVGSDGTVTPIGAWSGESWEDIGKEIKDNAVNWKKKGKILVSDGEMGLAEALASIVEQAQRCHWHAAHDVSYKMWEDKAPLDERKAMQSRVAGLIGIEVPEEDFEKVKEEDKAELAVKTEKAEEKLDELVAELAGKGYTKAASYVRNAKENLFSYVRFWLKYGLVCPRAASMIERMMREIGRRLKKIAFGWSEKGAAKMARIIIKRITSAGEWDDYWKKRLRLNGNVVIILRGVTAK